MPLERGVHPAIELRRAARGSSPSRCGPSSRKPGAHALGIGRQIERPERADLAVADEPGVGLDADDGAVEDGDGLAAGPLVGPLVQRQFDAIGEDAGDFHFEPMMNSSITS